MFRFSFNVSHDSGYGNGTQNEKKLVTPAAKLNQIHLNTM